MHKRADLKKIAEAFGYGRLSFCNPDELKTYLNITPGPVTPLCIMFDIQRSVKVLFDETLKAKRWLLIRWEASTFNTIRDKVGEDAAKIAKYINVLINLGFIKKEKLNTFIGHRFEQIISSNSPNGRVKAKSKACLDRQHCVLCSRINRT